MREETASNFFRFGRISKPFSILTILMGILIVFLPYPFPLNKLAIVVTGFVALVVFSLWNLVVPKKIDQKTKLFVEAMIGAIFISVVVHFSGGTESFFIFLYFLPALNIAANLNRSLTYSFLAVAFGFILIQGFSEIESSSGIAALSTTAFHLWSLGLVTAYGRLLAKEVNISKEKEEKTKVEQIEEVSKLKDEFVFIISHELRSPITAIRGYLELIMTDPRSKKVPGFEPVVAKAFFTANKLASLVSLLLEISRLETGKIKFYIQKVNLAEAVRLTMHGLSTDIESKHVNVIVEIPGEYEVFVDNERLIEILSILIENAVSFTPEFGKVRLVASRNLGGVSLSIEDDGIGIPKEVASQIFDKYFDTKDSVKKEAKGLGLGLYATKELLKAMRGEISVKSALGKGTTFTLSFPTSAY